MPSRRYFAEIGLGASSDLNAAERVLVGRDGYVAIQGRVHNGAGAAPTDTPQGTIELYAAAVDRYTLISDTTVTTELAKIKPNGNALVDTWAILSGIPGSWIKLRYVRTSGGGGDSRMTLDVVTWS